MGRTVVVAAVCAVGACTGGERGVDDWGSISSTPYTSSTSSVDAGGAAARPLDAAAATAAPATSAGADAAPALDVTGTPDVAVTSAAVSADGGAPGRADAASDVGGSDARAGLQCPNVDPSATDLVVNPGFASAVAPWTTESGVTQSRAPRDVAGSDASGSLLVSNNNVVPGSSIILSAGSRQCVPVAGATMYDVGVKQFIPSGQPAGAGIAVTYYASADCSGMALGASSVSLSNTFEAWTAQCGTATTPADARSMAVRLVVVKMLSDPAAVAFFDDVVVAQHR